MPEHPGGILKRLRHAQGMKGAGTRVYACIRAEVSMDRALLYCMRTGAFMLVNGRQH
jgi:hypothetical protein